jgi:ABC-type spermidine/putrescine transport system permease subunit II
VTTIKYVSFFLVLPIFVVIHTSANENGQFKKLVFKNCGVSLANHHARFAGVSHPQREKVQ